jgi:ribosomal protein S14
MKYRRQFKDINKRGLYKKTEIVQRLFRIICLNFQSNVLNFTLLNSNFLKQQYKYFRSHIKNFCVVSGRSKGVHKKFKVSRILLRELSNKGYFFGLKKAS